VKIPEEEGGCLEEDQGVEMMIIKKLGIRKDVMIYIILSEIPHLIYLNRFQMLL